ncbi:hypothetical protein [Entomoplasma ellychniae]|nr:hypothetical protein [Entomoplasma ellychniae]
MKSLLVKYLNKLNKNKNLYVKSNEIILEVLIEKILPFASID